MTNYMPTMFKKKVETRFFVFTRVKTISWHYNSFGFIIVMQGNILFYHSMSHDHLVIHFATSISTAIISTLKDIVSEMK